MRTSEKIDSILPAIMKVKAKLQAVTKSADNPFFKSKYADLNTHLDAVEPLLEENGLMLLQPVSIGSTGANVVSSTIIDKTGQFISSEMTVVAKELDMQKLGSAITYARRYTLGALLSMKTEDDDGNAASGKEKPAYKPAAKPAVQTGGPSNGGGTNSAKITANETVTAADKQAAPESKLLPQNGTRPSFRRPKATATPAAQPAQEEIVSNGDDL